MGHVFEHDLYPRRLEDELTMCTIILIMIRFSKSFDWNIIFQVEICFIYSLKVYYEDHKLCANMLVNIIKREKLGR